MSNNPGHLSVICRKLTMVAAGFGLVLACASPRVPSHLPVPATPAAPVVDASRELALGRAARVEGRTTEAREHLERAVRADPNGPVARLELADLFIAEGSELGTARILLQEAQVLRGDAERIARTGGALEELEGHEAQAVESYARALELAADPDLEVRRALLLLRLGRPGEAATELGSVLLLRPEDRGARAAQADACEAAEQLAAAEHALAVASALAPADAAPLRALASFYRRHGQRAKAAAVERQLRPDDRPARKLRPLLPARH